MIHGFAAASEYVLISFSDAHSTATMEGCCGRSFLFREQPYQATCCCTPQERRHSLLRQIHDLAVLGRNDDGALFDINVTVVWIVWNRHQLDIFRYSSSYSHIPLITMGVGWVGNHVVPGGWGTSIMTVSCANTFPTLASAIAAVNRNSRFMIFSLGATLAAPENHRYAIWFQGSIAIRKEIFLRRRRLIKSLMGGIVGH